MATAVQNAVAAIGNASYSGYCEKFVRTRYGFGAMYASARLAWEHAEGKHHGDMYPPAGVPVFWDITYGVNKPYDHIAISVGGGYCITTSAGPGRTIAKVSIAGLTKSWGMNYRGWAEVYHGKRVYTAPAKPKPGKLQHGWTTHQVNNIVNAMNRMGLKAGHPDGVYGPMLTNAVEAFQRHHGLVPDGIYGPKTQAVYFRNRKVQAALKREGYTKQTIDGYMGDQTEANVRDFQRRTGLVKDGVAGPKTRKRLGL